MNVISTEQIKAKLYEIPWECRDIVFSFLPKGHPVTTSQEIEKAFKELELIKGVQCSDTELEQVKLITSRVWIQLKRYSGYLMNYTSRTEPEFPPMPVLWGRFAVRFPLHFDINIRWTVQKAMAEIVANHMISEPQCIDYVKHLWFPLATLRTPIMNEFGVTWREVPSSIESEALDNLAEIRRDRINLREAKEIQCDCCKKITQLNLITSINDMISKYGFAQSLAKREEGGTGLQGIIPPAEVSTILATKILDEIDAWSKAKQKVLSPVDTCSMTSPDIKKFASYLERTISKRIELLRKRLIHGNFTINDIPVGSGDLPLLLNRVQMIANEPNTALEEQCTDQATWHSYVCVQLSVSVNRPWNCVFPDGGWMNHDFRLKGIVDLAFRLIEKGYHVKLT